jgi:hypothetical protein
VTAATPAPRTLYVHDDLSDALRALGEESRAWRLGQKLLAMLRRDTGRVVILTLAQQLDALIARGDHLPFACALGIGRAGARVAAQVHARTGWFPSIHRVDVWREEDGDGGYVIAGPAPLASQLGPAIEAPSIAIVDDTIFSGLTMRTVAAVWSADPRRRMHAFCLRAVGESLEAIAGLIPVTAGFAAAGRILDDVSFINASGLVERTAIRRAGQPSLAFFERPEWMAAWFPGYHEDVIATCKELRSELDAGPDPPS